MWENWGLLLEPAPEVGRTRDICDRREPPRTGDWKADPHRTKEQARFGQVSWSGAAHPRRAVLWFESVGLREQGTPSGSNARQWLEPSASYLTKRFIQRMRRCDRAADDACALPQRVADRRFEPSAARCRWLRQYRVRPAAPSRSRRTMGGADTSARPSGSHRPASASARSAGRATTPMTARALRDRPRGPVDAA